MSAHLRSVTSIVIMSTLLAAAAATACGSQPTAPAPIMPPVPPTAADPPRPTNPVRITGAVRSDRGEPLAGATIQLLGTTPVAMGVSDPSGLYELIGTAPALVGYELKAEKPGFEFNLQFVRSGTSTHDFQLRDIVRINAGDAKGITLAPSDSLYGFDLEWRRRTVRLVTPRSGVVDLEVVPENATARGGIAFHPFSEVPCCPSRRSISVAAGAEVPIHVLTFWDNTTDQTFTLRTALLPQ